MKRGKTCSLSIPKEEKMDEDAAASPASPFSAARCWSYQLPKDVMVLIRWSSWLWLGGLNSGTVMSWKTIISLSCVEYEIEDDNWSKRDQFEGEMCCRCCCRVLLLSLLL